MTPWVGLLLACTTDPSERNADPTVAPLSPADGERPADDVDLVLRIAVSDPDGDAPLDLEVRLPDATFEARSVAAASDLDVPIGRLPPGRHRVALRVTDPDGASATIDTTLMINGRPRAGVVMFSPADPGPGETVEAALSTLPSDPDGTPLGLRWRWVSPDSAETFEGRAFPAVLPGSVTALGQRWTLTTTAEELLPDGGPDTTGLSVSFTTDLTIGEPVAPAPTVQVTPSSPHPFERPRCVVGDVPPGASVIRRWLHERAPGTWIVEAGADQELLPTGLLRAGARWRCDAQIVHDGRLSPTAQAELTVLPWVVTPTPVRTLDPADAAAVWTVAGTPWIVLPDASTLHAWAPQDLLDPTAAPALTLNGPASGFGGCLQADADLSGDGEPELVACAEDAGRVWVIDGAARANARVFDVDSVGLSDVDLPGASRALALPLAANTRPSLLVLTRAAGLASVLHVLPPGRFTQPGPLGVDDVAGQVMLDLDDPLGTLLHGGMDLTGEGTPDVLLGGPTTVSSRTTALVFSRQALGNGDPLTAADAPLRLLTDEAIAAGALADLDGDGNGELWLRPPDGELLLLAGGLLGAVEVSPATARIRLLSEPNVPGFGRRVSTLDLDGDRHPDLAVAADTRLYLFRGAEIAAAWRLAGTTLSATDAAWVIDGAQPRALLAVDVDLDGQPDLFTGDAHGGLAVWPTTR